MAAQIVKSTAKLATTIAECAGFISEEDTSISQRFPRLFTPTKNIVGIAVARNTTVSVTLRILRRNQIKTPPAAE